MADSSNIERSILQDEISAFLRTVLHEGAMRDVPRWLYFDLSRQRNGHKEPDLARVIALVRSVPTEVAFAIGALIDDEIRAAHPPVAQPLHVRLLQVDEDDSKDDRSRYRLALVLRDQNATADELRAALRDFIRDSRGQERSAADARVDAMGELQRLEQEAMKRPHRAPQTTKRRQAACGFTN